MVFGWLFHNQYGVANYLLGLVGIKPQKWLLEWTPTLRLLLEARRHATPGCRRSCTARAWR